MRSVTAVFVGFAVWWLCYAAQFLTSVLVFGYSAEGYFSVGLISFFGTTIGLILSSMVMKKVYSQSGRREFLYLIGLIAVWMGSSLIDGTDRDYRLVALGGAMLAATISVKQTGWEV